MTATGTLKSPFAPHRVKLAHGQALAVGPVGLLMGVLNVTPDSFSDGGRFSDVDSAVSQARCLAEQGAAIIDIGAESTRPGAAQIDAATEQERLLPVVEAVAKALPDAILSIDTYRSETAVRAIAAGGHILNDVWGLQKDVAMAEVAADTGAGLVIMHTNRGQGDVDDVIEDQKAFLGRSLEIAAKAGVTGDRIMLDPGFGFGKDPDHNLTLMARFDALVSDPVLGAYPFLVGTSRKRFVGHVTGRDVGDRDVATAATTALLRIKGAAVFRVHDVAMNADALAMADAMLAAEGGHV